MGGFAPPNPLGYGSDVIRLPVLRPGVKITVAVATNSVEVGPPISLGLRPDANVVHFHVGGLPSGSWVEHRTSSEFDHGITPCVRCLSPLEAMVECGFDPRLTPGTQLTTNPTTINLQPQARAAQMLSKIRV